MVKKLLRPKLIFSLKVGEIHRGILLGEIKNFMAKIDFTSSGLDSRSKYSILVKPFLSR